jgi:DNA-binding MarR family transcriptional regulator
MSKKQEFINWVEEIIEIAKVDEIPENVKMYWEAFKGNSDSEKPLFTDNGKLILRFLQEHQETTMWKAREIGEGLFINSRGVSGAMRKLVSDGFCEKMGESPVIYTLTEKGKNFVIED